MRQVLGGGTGRMRQVLREGVGAGAKLRAGTGRMRQFLGAGTGRMGQVLRAGTGRLRPGGA